MTFGTRTETTLKRAEFRGNAGEYFGIWIVNILLTIVTLGVYSAWAKVRRMRYFRGSTFLDGHSFDYHARGLQIFLGRLIVFGFVIVIQILTAALPLLAIVTPLLFLAFLPWLIMRSLRFNARVTSYRNVRFNFLGTTWGAFKAVILGGIVSTISLGILAPLASRWVYRYIFNNLTYGDRRFVTDPRVGAIYRGWFLPAAMVVIGLAIAGAMIVLIALPRFSELQQDMSGGSVSRQAVVTMLLIYAIIIPIIIVFTIANLVYVVVVRNVVLNCTLFDGIHPLFSDLSRGRYLWIIISNVVVTILTLGLMRPWAAVREARYMAEHTGVVPKGEIGEVMSSILASGSAASAEYLDMEGMDFGF